MTILPADLVSRDMIMNSVRLKRLLTQVRVVRGKRVVSRRDSNPG